MRLLIFDRPGKAGQIAINADAISKIIPTSTPEITRIYLVSATDNLVQVVGSFAEIVEEVQGA